MNRKTQLGATFGESIFIGSSKQGNWPKDKETTDARPSIAAVFLIILAGSIIILVIRLLILTVLEGGAYRKLSQENRIREIRLPAPRGIIFDRNGEPLVRNIPVFRTKDGNIYFEKVEKEGNSWIFESTAREYMYGDLFAHVIGYTGEIDETKLNMKNASLQQNSDGKDEKGQTSYKRGDIIGKMGVEASYDEAIRGVVGKELFEVDAAGELVRSLGKVESQPGENLTLTLDASLQHAAKDALSERKGAVVVSNPIDGQVLALYSFPSFDPNAFIRSEGVDAILENSQQPLFNRAISGTYPPGSTFKPIVGVAALESKTVTAATVYEDTGILKVGAFSFANWYFTQYGRTEGFVNMVKAIQRSNDIYFYKVGEATGIETVAGWARKFGLGKPLGIDIPGEAEGLMPDPSWMKKTKGENWYLGNTYHIAIGQGDILTTPLQVNGWMSAIANGGKLCPPHVVAKIGGKATKDSCRNLEISRSTLEVIREGMINACKDGGTGWPLFSFKIPVPASMGQAKFKIDNANFLDAGVASSSGNRLTQVVTACKTGTSEFGDEKKRTHAWFTIFAPAYKPEIAVTVLVEAGGEGSSVAGPIAKKILEAWFTR